MAQTYKAKNMKVCGVDDMILLTKIEVPAIVENLEKRLKADLIYTYVANVLVAVNPFKALPYFTDKELDMYQCAAQYENPPHIYALCDEMYRNMITDMEPQCCIISGESGAGKTVSAKYVMNYITKVSGGGKNVDRVKEIILQSNPVLEAFGNAKTNRNDNSSRFGKYVEMLFQGGSPIGGKISNFLLEKSRVVTQNKGERNFHIFYQIICGSDSKQKNEYSLNSPETFYYTNQSGCSSIPNVDDAKEYADVLTAFDIIELDKSTSSAIIKLMAGILHLGNVQFHEEKNQAQANDASLFDMPSKLLGVDAAWLQKKLISREMESKWGKSSEIIQLEHNLEQANFTRDALAKGIYGRVFTFLVEAVNKAIAIQNYETSIGILDIYGFEIFNKNGFEQFCINYVNEKLQQIFIELTLKAEQEEYVKEGIKWAPIKYFNNKVVCDLIESKRNPVGIMSILDDVCATMHAKSDGADSKLTDDLGRSINCPAHFTSSGSGFTVTHYAGRVTYSSDGFCEKNRDVFYIDLIELMKSSNIPFLQMLFPEDIAAEKSKGKPSTSSQAIKVQANILVDKLMKCNPFYIRCIKPNETKKPYDFEKDRVKHQVEYLGIKENIRVKRAGFAFRRPFDKFLQRFKICTPETFPKWNGPATGGCEHICKSVNMESDEFQIGATKIFIKKPESLFLLEEVRERKYDHFAIKIQKIWREYHSKIKVDKHRSGALNIVVNKKKRFYGSISRKFYGDYIGMEERPSLRTYMERKEKVHFSDVLQFFGDKLKPQKVDYMVTQKFMYLVGREKVKKGPNKNQLVEVLLRKVDLSLLSGLTMSPFQDDVIMINVQEEASVLISTPFKTELAYILSSMHKDLTNKVIRASFETKFKYPCQKKKKITNLNIEFKEVELNNDAAKFKASGSKLVVSVKAGKPESSQPVMRSMPTSGANQYNSTSKTAVSANKTQTKTSAPPTFATPPHQAPPPPPIQQKKNPTALALWAYEASAPDEISFVENDVIEILEEDPTGWWLGICNGKKGVFPGNYVEKQ